MIDPLTALLAGAAGGAVLVCDDVEGDAFSCPHGQRMEARELARALTERDDVAVVVVDAPRGTLLRALRRAPPPLLVITGPSDPLAGDTKVPTLGPNAALRVREDAGPFLLCATTRSELAALERVIGSARARVAVSPTPAWLLRWLAADGPLARAIPLGYVGLDQLNDEWTRWYRDAALAAIERGGPHPVLVPLGHHDAPVVDRPFDEPLAALAAAHNLECLTGPVFPAPTVISALATTRDVTDPRDAEAEDDDADAEEPSEEAMALWSQARRAVPLLGSTVGMDRPRAGLPLTIPTAAFLAQRALLRRAHARALLEQLRAEELELEMNEELQTRAVEVLRSAGEALSEHESKVVLRGFGIEITRQAVASSASGAAHFAERIGFPVVLKAVSPDLRRKQELGAVVLDQATAASVRRAYSQIIRNVEEHAPTARLDGVLVAEQIGEGLEIECGVIRTDDEGFAFYGRAVGVPAQQEFVLAPAPLRPEFALLLANAVLAQVPVPGLRRSADPPPELLAELLLRLNALVEACGTRLLSVELNPIRLVGPPRGYVTLDARIVQQAHIDGL